MQIHTPPIGINKQAEARKAGFEFEYAKLKLDDSATILAGIFPGEIEQVHPHHYILHNAQWGDFDLKLDVLWMQKLSEQVAESPPGENKWAEAVTDYLSPVLSSFMPYEIVTPPLTLDQIPKLDTLCRRLAEAGARDTEASPFYAFGMHINPDLPAIPLASLHRYLMAFVLLQEWLMEENHVDVTRRLSPYIHLFGEDYRQHILRPSYHPDIETLIDDYLAYNPSRNRALDMLPLFAYIDEARVRKIVKDEHVKARPAFHYRLPNCNLENPSWSVVHDWNLWIEVERLAEDKARLITLRDAYLNWSQRPLGNLLEKWVDEVRKFYHPRLVYA